MYIQHLNVSLTSDWYLKTHENLKSQLIHKASTHFTHERNLVERLTNFLPLTKTIQIRTHAQILIF